jgi:DNA repair ATPase RecN
MKYTRQLLLRSTIAVLALIFAGSSCTWRSPEDLPKFKKRFKEQIEIFEKKKEQANDKVITGLKELTALEKAIQDARNVDKEFNRVYGDWKKVDNKVKHLNREYEQLKKYADDLFSAIERQVSSLNDEKNKRDLLAALNKSKKEYNKTLSNTSEAISELRALHNDAVDIVKALEAAVAIGQISEINDQLKGIRSRVDGIMKELNETVRESQSLYSQRLGEIS